jgi:cytochrome c peroxidase
MTLVVSRLARPAVPLLLAAALVSAAQADPGPAQRAVLAQQAEAARAAAPGFAPSAERGRALFMSSPAAGKPDTPSCTSCHTTTLTRAGQGRAGKAIEPMAPSVVPTRLSDAATVEKWFRRNCPDVLGRDCSAAEKADLLAFLIGL